MLRLPPLIVNLLPSCYGLLKITWVLTPKIASPIIWWSVTKYVAKLSKCTLIKALSNIWSTNSKHFPTIKTLFFFLYFWMKIWKLLIFTRLQNLLICMIFGCFFVHQADFYLPVYMHMNFFKTFNGLHPLYTIQCNYIWCMSTMNLFCKKNRERIFFRNVLAVHIFSSFKRKFKDEIS